MLLTGGKSASNSILGDDISEVRELMTVKVLERNDKPNVNVPVFKAGGILQAGEGETLKTAD